jgi:hypothetical protein
MDIASNLLCRVLAPLLRALDDQPLLCDCEDERPCSLCEPPLRDAAA